MPLREAERILTLPLPIAKPWFTERPIDYGDSDGPSVQTVLNEKGCVFLQPNGLCGIHAYCVEHGLDFTKYKPKHCQDFPYEHEKLHDLYSALCGVFFGEDKVTKVTEVR